MQSLNLHRGHEIVTESEPAGSSSSIAVVGQSLPETQTECCSAASIVNLFFVVTVGIVIVMVENADEEQTDIVR
jgi:hypothetical protein